MSYKSEQEKEADESGQTAFEDGIEAYHDGIKMNMAPYPSRSFSWDVWRNGWLFARQEERGEFQ